MTSDRLRDIPAVGQLLDSPPLRALVEELGHQTVARGVRQYLDGLRERVSQGRPGPALDRVDELAAGIARDIQAEVAPRLRSVINATGVLLHTGLGRAPLAAPAVDSLADITRGYASVELDLAFGRRSRRVEAVAGLLCDLTGAEAALVVNNNAGATLLALAALAAGREVIVSRGQLIEIGGSYRLPDVMAAGGTVLREVGTTNKTHLDDYRAAIGEHTAALLLVHTSNYVVEGFTSSVPLGELARLGAEHGLPVIHDVGSGALVDFAEFGLRDEPNMVESIAAGADLVLASGDKLLGGPQCGIAIGRRELVDRMSRHPLARALRVDKMTLAALAATLELYRRPERARAEIPLLVLLSVPASDLAARAHKLAEKLSACAWLQTATAVADVAYIGGGSVPSQQVPTWCVALRPADRSVDRLAEQLRAATPGVVGRVSEGRLLLDLRSVFVEQDEVLWSVVHSLGAADSDPRAAASAS